MVKTFVGVFFLQLIKEIELQYLFLNLCTVVEELGFWLISIAVVVTTEMLYHNIQS